MDSNGLTRSHDSLRFFESSHVEPHDLIKNCLLPQDLLASRSVWAFGPEVTGESEGLQSETNHNR